MKKSTTAKRKVAPKEEKIEVKTIQYSYHAVKMPCGDMLNIRIAAPGQSASNRDVLIDVSSPGIEPDWSSPSWRITKQHAAAIGEALLKIAAVEA